MKLLGILCQVLLGVVFAAAGLALLLWVAAVHFEPDLAIGAAIWTVTSLSLPLTVTPP